MRRIQMYIDEALDDALRQAAAIQGRSAASVVRDAVRRHNPTVFKGKVAKIYYATQTAVNPPTFVFFVNDPQAVHFSYERYLENQLRAEFGFKGTGIRMFFRARPKSEQSERQ